MNKHYFKIKAIYWAAILTVLFSSLIQSIWYRAADVVWFEKAELISLHLNIVQMKVLGYKVRNCHYIPGSEVGYTKGQEDYWIESKFQYIDDLSPDSNKPSSFLQRISFGIWEWNRVTPPNKGALTKVLATVSHDCGDGDIRTTRIGPFDLPSMPIERHTELRGDEDNRKPIP